MQSDRGYLRFRAGLGRRALLRARTPARQRFLAPDRQCFQGIWVGSLDRGRARFIVRAQWAVTV